MLAAWEESVWYSNYAFYKHLTIKLASPLILAISSVSLNAMPNDSLAQ